MVKDWATASLLSQRGKHVRLSRRNAEHGVRVGKVANHLGLEKGFVELCYRIFIAYLRDFLACFTRFSMTPSKASLSPNALSLRFSQYSSTSLALAFASSSSFICACSSPSVIFDSAATVVAQSNFVAWKSSSGGAGGPFLLLALVDAGRSAEAVEVLSCFNRTRESCRRPYGGD